ncbi:hypothetical protein EVAR_24866_1 [Eumeta japonica]|uniref:Uncharacterized protein n=1 Tax=Eumeta variegata TaxID=151549 RepID=A0A4C1Y8Q6_EUMVA|nr:hypothetical protein EVAR_24866_1 [Eumeta japonica]
MKVSGECEGNDMHAHRRHARELTAPGTHRARSPSCLSPPSGDDSTRASRGRRAAGALPPPAAGARSSFGYRNIVTKSRTKSGNGIMSGSESKTGCRAESKTGSESESKARPEPKLRTGLGL